MVRMLPIVEIEGKKYFRDDRLHEFRNIYNPHERISFVQYGAKKFAEKSVESGRVSMSKFLEEARKKVFGVDTGILTTNPRGHILAVRYSPIADEFGILTEDPRKMVEEKRVEGEAIWFPKKDLPRLIKKLEEAL